MDKYKDKEGAIYQGILKLLQTNTIRYGGEAMRKNKISWVIAGLGAAVTGIGSLVRGPLGSGLKGFGLAHILLGTLDMFRPSKRHR
jgi:hypothetical protein